MMIRGFLLWLVAAIGTLCLLLLLAAVGSLLQIRTAFSGTAELPADCAVVFGATVHGRERAGPGITRRVETAVRLYKEGDVRFLILTGGKGDDMKESEAAVMAALAREMGVPSSALRTEDLATSTWENLRYARPLTADCASVVGISDRYHLRRIDLLAAMQGWEDLEMVAADRSAGSSFEAQNLIRETLGILYYSFVPSRYL